MYKRSRQPSVYPKLNEKCRKRLSKLQCQVDTTGQRRGLMQTQERFRGFCDGNLRGLARGHVEVAANEANGSKKNFKKYQYI